MIHQDSPLWRAWAAGVAESKIRFPHEGYQIKFDTIDYELVTNFHQRVGVGALTNRGFRNGCLHEIWEYHTNNMDDSRTLILYIAPFLGNRFSKKATEMLKRIEDSPTWQRKFPEKAAQRALTKGVALAGHGRRSRSSKTEDHTASPAESLDGSKETTRET